MNRCSVNDLARGLHRTGSAATACHLSILECGDSSPHSKVQGSNTNCRRGVEGPIETLNSGVLEWFYSDLPSTANRSN